MKRKAEQRKGKEGTLSLRESRFSRMVIPLSKIFGSSSIVSDRIKDRKGLLASGIKAEHELRSTFLCSSLSFSPLALAFLPRFFSLTRIFSRPWLCSCSTSCILSYFFLIFPSIPSYLPSSRATPPPTPRVFA